MCNVSETRTIVMNDMSETMIREFIANMLDVDDSEYETETVNGVVYIKTANKLIINNF